MKLDYDLIRKQLTDIEEERDVLADIPQKPNWNDSSWTDWEEYEKELNKAKAIESRIAGHLEILLLNGYADGFGVVRGAGGDEFSYGTFTPRLTLAGHELLATMRSKDLWEKIKSTAESKGFELTFEFIKITASAVVQSFFK